ncbi:unnamed protein product [Gadus morhua 'NCC']
MRGRSSPVASCSSLLLLHPSFFYPAVPLRCSLTSLLNPRPRSDLPLLPLLPPQQRGTLGGLGGPLRRDAAGQSPGPGAGRSCYPRECVMRGFLAGPQPGRVMKTFRPAALEQIQC